MQCIMAHVARLYAGTYGQRWFWAVAWLIVVPAMLAGGCTLSRTVTIVCGAILGGGGLGGGGEGSMGVS